MVSYKGLKGFIPFSPLAVVERDPRNTAEYTWRMWTEGSLSTSTGVAPGNTARCLRLQTK